MLRRLFSSAVTAYLVMFSFFAVGFFQVHHDEHKNCVATQREWATFNRLIDAAVHPPTQAGHVLTGAQEAALKTYRDSLRASIGPRPGC